MKIALVIEWLDPWRGGAETSTWQFVHHLQDRGVDVHLFTRSRPSPTPHLAVHTINGASMSRTRQSMTFAHRVDRALAQQDFDVVHAISPCPSADIYQPRGGTVAETVQRNLALRRPGPARLFKRYANRLNFKQQFLLRLEEQLLGHDDGPLVVAISDYVVRQLKQHYRVPDERIVKIYNGVNPDASTAEEQALDRQTVRREFGIAENDFLVLLVAHNFRLKGVHRWIEALAHLQHSGRTNIRSLVAGKGDTAWWHKKAARLGVADVLSFAGPTGRVAQFYHAADVLVHPTYYDPCSRVVLEAMSAGLPVITTRWDGAAEAIQHGESGFVLNDPADVEGLAGCVVDLMDTDRRMLMGQNAKEAVRQASMSSHASQMMDVYRRLKAKRTTNERG